MKFSKAWLLQHVDIEIATPDLVAGLTMAGLEVDGVEPAAPPFTNVVVGEIVAIEPHPDADQLRVCRVGAGGDAPVQVVCGAPNARLGLKAPFAQIGACLPGELTIKAARLRGVESQGMLCSAAELGLSSDQAGLLELPADLRAGTDLRAALALDDEVIEVDLTPNRGDCLGVRGLAREVAAVMGAPLQDFPVAPVPATIADALPIRLNAAGACPRYAGRIIRAIDPEAKTPVWMLERLRRGGIRGIHPVVDVTNYVMLELGQPMHGFDLGRLHGTGIEVRHARSGETLTLLDGNVLELDAGCLVIADAQRTLALAGIMGGRDSGVDAQTRDVFLESAHFQPLAVAGKARQFGLHTDSSHRFERGVDPELPLRALERATALLLEITGGKPGPALVAEDTGALAAPGVIQLRRKRLAQQLRLDFAPERVKTMLASLGLELVEETPDHWQFRAPSWRFDLGIEADLIEEIARIHGYNNLPSATPVLAPEIGPSRQRDLAGIRAVLVQRGYREVICYSFVPPEIAGLVTGGAPAIPVINPISAAMSVMRPSLWPGLLLALRHNLNRQQERVRLFETGLRFGGGPDGEQRMTLAGLITGNREPEGWANARDQVDFFALKGDVEALLAALGIGARVSGERGTHPALHPGQCLRLRDDGDATLGHLGLLSPVVARALDFDQPVFLFELALDRLPGAATAAFRSLSRFPAVRRDIAIVVPREVTAAAVLGTVKRASGESLTEARIFDVYHGEHIENNKKSIAIGLTFQDSSRTLEDSDVQSAEAAVLEALAAEFGARLRGE
ncbi:MAG: phenylalanine--tRNA ligase subunit beta [Gammaproteobacteria bacterium]|nr:phenylalanine--tRNA ligase subunit beta [Gammaproteobacteria bacterium]